MIQQDNAVGDVFLQPLARQRAVAALGGDDGGHALVLQPAEQAAQFGTQDGFVLQAAEQGFQRIEHDAFGADRVDQIAQPDEQTLQVVVARLLDFAGFDVDLVDDQLAVGFQLGQVEAQRGDVLLELLGAFLEGEEHPGLVVAHGAQHQEFHGQQRLATARAAADQGRPAARQAAFGDFVETVYAGRCLRQSIADNA